ncbi:MAG: ATP-binding cassette domain-containing protein [Vicinamibacterales bacterium]|nr:ATP-binding cassette domain-containing protein [Vicinamibacterales bacterium]
MPLVSLDQVSMAHGHVPLLEAATLRIEAGDRVCVIGRNGAGKSTLLQLLAGEQPPDQGLVRRERGVQVSLLAQDALLSSDRPVFDIVAEGLGELAELVSTYHRAATEVGAGPTPARLDALGRLQQALEARDGWRVEQRVELVIERLRLPAEAIVNTLSGGWRRRVLLARALVAQPQVLLLDEPTNHLDIEAIDWLEAFAVDYPGAVVVVTHDRQFLRRVATSIVELDRGRLTSWPGDYDNYERRLEERRADEAVRHARDDKRQAVEEVWLRQGVKARRTRNEGRVNALMTMRAERADRRVEMGRVRLKPVTAEASGRLVFDAERIAKSFGETCVIPEFDLRVMRGDRIGLIGPNGAGKTTLLRVLLGELEPDHGTVRRGTNVQIAYYDQQREQLDVERTVFDVVGDGNDMVTVDGESRHVHGYLRDFLFSPERARSPVKSLSGGERNRLLLARLFTRPANVLVLDEPTNDLDLDTLELLESQLVEWTGTVLLVSHDRVFLDHVVSSTVVFEAGGQIREYVGGYQDWLRQRPVVPPPTRPGRSKVDREAVKTEGRASAAPSRLSYNDQRELVALPERIERLEAEISRMNAATAAPGFYREAPDAIKATLAGLETAQEELVSFYTRWEHLESRRGNFRG